MTISLHSVEIGSGETLYYRKAGTGPKALLLIHGNMSSSRHWEPLMKVLSLEYTLYAVDLRGFGDSTYHRPIQALVDFADDLVLLADALNLPDFIPVGWSTGGGVAMYLAATQPHRVEKLILVESMSYRGYPIFRKDPQGQPLPGQFYASKEEMAADPIQVVPAVAALKAGNSEYLKMLWDLLIYVVNKPPEEEYRETLAATMKQRNLVDVDWALTSFNIGSTHNGVTEGTGLVDQITCPVLSFWGDKDLVVTRGMVEETAEAIGDTLRLVYLENCGHSPLVDALDILAAEIKAFVGGP